MLTLKKGPKEGKLKFRDDVVVWSKRFTEKSSIDNSEVVFVGYGVQAPEFDWDDRPRDAVGRLPVVGGVVGRGRYATRRRSRACLLYTSDAADE